MKGAFPRGPWKLAMSLRTAILCGLTLWSFTAKSQSCTGTGSFTVSSPLCVSSSATFTNTSSSTTTASTYYWRWGDGSISDTVTSIGSKTHTYSSAGTYTVWLVRRGSTCKDSVSKSIKVGSTTKPTASFSFTPNNACMGTVSFTDGSTGSGLDYSWDFGDGSTSTSQNPSHFFKSYGSSTHNFSVKLTVSNGCKTDDTTITVTVKQAPQPLLDDDLNPTSPFVQCASTSTVSSFKITAKNYTSGASSHKIDWGDGSSVFTAGSSFDTVSHTYSSSGTFNLKFTVTGSNGCSADTIIQVVNESNPSVGLTTLGSTNGCAPITFKYVLSGSNVTPTTQFVWNFSDGTTVTWDYTKAKDTISHTFTTTSCGQNNNEFIVSVTATNGCGQTVATVSGTKIARKPIANFNQSGTTGCAGSTNFSFTDASTLNCLGGTHKYAWNFGDGTGWSTLSPFGANATHVYTKVGTFSICHVVQNTCGTDTICKTVTTDTIPLASFNTSLNPSNGCVPVTATFTNTSSRATSMSYSWSVSPTTGWSYQSGSTSTSANPVIIFSTAGTYIVTLTASNGCGSTTFKDTIDARQKPSVTIAAISNGCAPYTVNPSASFNANNGAITAYSWTMTGGSPSSSTSQSPGSVTYGTAGTYKIVVSATNACGTTKDSTTFTVNPQPAAANSGNKTICIGQSVSIGATAVSGNTYSWTSSPAGFTSSNANPTVSPTSTTSYFLTETITATGCQKKDTVVVTVNSLPTVDAGSNETICIDKPAYSLTGHSPSGGTWSGTGVSSGGTFTPSTAGSGTKTLTYSYTNPTTGCTNTDTKTITVNALPTVTTKAKDTFCNSSTTVTFTGTPSGGTWKGSGVTSGGVFTPSTAGNGTHNIYYVYTSPSTGCKDSALKQVTVVSPATANAGPDDTVCVNDAAFSLTGYSPSSGGAWSGTGVNSSGTFTPSSAGVGNHTLTYTYGTGTCLVTDTKVIKVNGLPTVDAGSNETICIDKPAYSLTGQSPSGGTWSGTGVSSGGTFTPSSAGSGTKTLTYSYTDPSTGCTNTDTKTITVNALPTVTTKAKDTFCNSSTTVTFTGTPSGGTWEGSGVTSGGVFTPSTAGNGTHNLYYVYTSPSTGCKDSALKQVTVVSPSSINAGNNDTVCLSASAFSLTGHSPSGGTWSGTGVSSAGTFTPSTAGAGTHTLTYSFGTGTCLVTDTKIVKVNALPTVDAGSNETICIDKPAYSLTGHSPSGGSWSGTGVSSAGVFTPSTAGSGTKTLTYSYTDANGCTNTDTKTITVNALPTVTTDPKDTFCNSSTTVSFTGSPSGGTWKGNGVTSGGTFTPSTAGNGTHNLYYVYTSPSTGCKDSALKEVTVVVPSSVDAGPNDTVCVSASAFSLTGYSPSTGGSWSGTGVTSSGTFTPATAGVGNHTLTYNYGTGTCLVTDTKIVKVNPLPTVDAGSNETICIDKSAYSMTGHSPSGGTWSGTGMSSGGTFTPSTAGAGTHTVTYTYTDPTTHCTNSDTKTIKINALPAVTTKAKDTFCNTSTTVTFTGTPSGGVWKGSGVTTAGVFTPSSAGVGTHNIYFVFTDAGTGCKDSAKREVTVVSPSTVDAGPNDTVCVSDAAFSLTGYTPSSGGVWSGTAVTSSGTFTPATAGAGTFTLTYSYGTGTCLVTDTKIIKVNALPTVDAGSNEVVCIDKPAYTVTGQSPTGGTWSGTGITSGGTFTAATAGSGTHTITYSYTDPTTGCKNTDTKTIKVNALPTVTTKAQDTFCNTSTIVTFTGTPSGGTWKGSGVTSAGVFTPSSAGVGTHNIYYVYTDGGTGCKDSAKKEVTVVNPSTVDAGANDTVCVSDAAFSLTGYSPASGGSWSGTAVTSTGTFTPATAGAGTFTLTYSYGTGTCLVTDTKIIKVNALPTVDAGSNEVICIDKPAYSMTGQSPTGGSWSGTGISSSGTFTPSTAGSGTHTITYTYTDPATGCQNTDTKTIKVNALPTVSTKAQDTFCNTSTTVTFTGTPSGGTWKGTGVTSTGVFTPSTAGVGTHNIYYVYTDGGTGCRDSAKKTVEVVAPVSIDAGQNDTVCVSDADYNLTGYTPSSGGTWSGTGVTAAGKFSPSTGAGVYTLTYTYGVGTCKVTDTKTVKVNALPTVDAGSNEVICIDKPSYSMTGHSPTGGTWSGTGISSSGTFTPSTAGSGTHTITYTYTDPTTHCKNTDTKTIKVNALPTVSTKAQDTFCNTSTTVTFTGTPSGGVWHGKGVTLAGVFTPSSAGVGSHNIYYVYTDGGTGCTDSAKKAVEVVAPVSIDAGQNDTVCVSDADYNLTGYTPSSGGAWSGTGVTGGGKFSPSTGAGTYTLTYTYGTGTCKVTDTKIVKVNALPTVDAGSNEVICIDKPAYSMTGHSPTGGTWSGTGISSSGVFTASTAGSGTHTLTYTYKDPTTKCTNTDTKTIKVNALPVVTTKAQDTFCNTSITVTFTASPTGGTWKGKGVSSSGVFTPSSAGVGSHNIYYVYTDATTGCRDSAKKAVEVVDPAVIDAGVNDTVCVSDPDFNLSGYKPASGGTWSGTGVTSAGKFSPATGVGTYTLTYTYGTGTCKVTDTKIVRVNPLPMVHAAGPYAYCLNEPVATFSGHSPTGGIWTGNGIVSSTNGTFSPAFAGVGIHKIVYRVTDPITKCINRDTLTVEVYPLPKFSIISDSFNCKNTPASFNGNAFGTYSYFWIFGDGNTASGKNVTHAYANTGWYDITLVATDSNGCRDTSFTKIRIAEPPTAKFSRTPFSGPGPHTVSFTNQSFGEIDTYAWDFGDGQKSTVKTPPDITFQQSDNGDTVYFVKHTVTNRCGSSVWIDSVKVFPLPKARFGTDRNEGCSPLTIKFSNKSVGKPDTYFWDFGNGKTSTLKDPPPQVYTTDSLIKKYKIILVATNKYGVDTATWEITVYPKNVTAFFNPNPQTGCAPATFTFTDYSKGGTFISWSFGDGDSSAAQNPVHTYTKEGTYKVKQFVNNGCSYDTAEFDIQVFPAANVKWFAHPACASDSIQFLNLSQNIAGGVWNFGDGDTSTVLNPKHKYKTPGKYAVTLTGKSITHGCVASYTDTAYAMPLPVSSFTADPIEGCKPLKVQFTNTGTDSVFYIWSFGDGNTSIEEDPSHTFNDSGIYLITLRTINKLGCSNEFKSFIKVHPYPISKFVIPSVPYCGGPQTITFANNSISAGQYEWIFSNGENSTVTTPTVTFDSTGTYSVMLIATNAYGCKDTSRQEFTIHVPPTADFSVVSTACQMDSVQFINQSKLGLQFEWDFGDSSYSTEENPKHQYKASGQYTVTLKITGAGGCKDSITKTNIITINTKPTVGLIFTVDANPVTGWTRFTGAPGDMSWYKWDFGDGKSDNGADLDVVIHRYDLPGNYKVRLIIINKFGCSDTIEVSPGVEYFDGLFVPNALSPESGIDEERIFLPKGANLEDYRLEIYNTWGELLWWTEELDKGHPSEPFIGEDRKGRRLPQGAYVWKISATFANGLKWQGKDYNGNKKPMGTVTIIR